LALPRDEIATPLTTDRLHFCVSGFSLSGNAVSALLRSVMPDETAGPAPRTRIGRTTTSHHNLDAARFSRLLKKRGGPRQGIA
jgi:hypothetical protein